MKLLVDACVAKLVVDRLIVAGHAVDWVGHWPGSPSDKEILSAAAASK